MSVADSDLLELDPVSAPWTMTSEVGHYDRSELHGTEDQDDATPTTPEGALRGAAHDTPSTPYAFQRNTATTPATTPGRKVLDRPRNRGPRPTEMGGVPIAHGTLPAQVPTPRATRSVSDSVQHMHPAQPMPTMRHASAGDARVVAEDAAEAR